jgi:nicotinate dehydrogenase subunit A
MGVSLNVNGVLHTSPAAPETPLLYILRNDLGLDSARYGCGAAQCGACNVLLDNRVIRSCVVSAAAASQGKITTLEGLGKTGKLNALQRAFIEEQAVQCGYCIPGIIISAQDLLTRVRNPDEGEIRTALDRNLCRCGTHTRILRAIARAAKEPA